LKANDLGLLCARLALGIVFVMHGLMKFFPATVGGGGGIPGFTQFLTGLEIPYPAAAAWIVAGWELGGGAAVALGIFPRIAALGLFANMLVAIAKVHLRNGFFLETHGFEFALTLALVSLAVILAGPGKISAMALFAKKKKG
jgi:putative oxidoreductase